MTEPASPGAGAAAPLRWQHATLREVEPLTPRIKRFLLAPGAPFAFRAGQHVQLRLTAEDGYQAQRSYSIASAPDETSLIELAVERLDDGEVSPFLHDVARPGDAFELRGPIGGHFVWSADEASPVVLVGGGSGVVPLVSMARHRAARRASAPMLLVVSARTWDDVAFRDELLALDRARDGFALALATTREPPRRPGDLGRRLEAAALGALLGRLPAQAGRAYVCGANRFVEAVAQGLATAGMPVDRIRTERYGGA